jgi:ABC-type phosphate/phosphonate transport system substrate-binding protein
MYARNSTLLSLACALALAAVAHTSAAAEAARAPIDPAGQAQRTSFAPPAATRSTGPLAADESFYANAGTESSPFVFSAPPRGKREEEIATYQPIADMLSAVSGKKFVYRYPDNWLNYSKEMVKGTYDLVFDGPAFNGWRIMRLEHTPLVKLPEDFVFVIIARTDNPRIQDVKGLAGRKICAHAPPNLGTLTLLSQFDNPARQPMITTIEGWKRAYEGLMAGECEGTVVPVANLKKLDPQGTKARVLYRHQAMPNNAFSAGPRIARDVQEKIRSTLLSEQGKSVTAKLRSQYAGKDFVSATREEYASLGVLLKDSVYYY